MKRVAVAALAASASLVALSAAAHAQTVPARAPVTIVPPARSPVTVPPPPPVAGPTTSAIFNAMLAVSRAQQSNPQAAQTASFQYVKALQQYRSGDYAGARRSAIEAQSTAAQPAMTVPTPAPVPTLPPASSTAGVPGTQGGLYGGDAPAIDADTFLALARGTIADCAARKSPALPTARQHYAAAAQAFAARNWQGTRIEAKAAIDACAHPSASDDTAPK